MRDSHHDQSSTPDVGDERRPGDARELAPDPWPPKRRATDGPIAMIADDIRQRLAPICRDWSEHDFEVVVQRIARMKLRWMQLDRVD
ncbi:MAG TPA: hypothetical protein VFY85_06350 [Gemmatimonadaceae bacterium]|nr:hypothetical protein [Gemmatimonadaceae bacterium]